MAQCYINESLCGFTHAEIQWVGLRINFVMPSSHPIHCGLYGGPGPGACVYVPGLRRVVDSTVFSQPGLTLEPDPRPNPCQEEGSIFGSGMLPQLFLFPTKQSCTYLPSLELLNKTVFNYSWSSFSSLLIQNPSWLINWRLIQQIHNKSEKRNILNFAVLLKT